MQLKKFSQFASSFKLNIEKRSLDCFIKKISKFALNDFNLTLQHVQFVSCLVSSLCKVKATTTRQINEEKKWNMSAFNWAKETRFRLYLNDNSRLYYCVLLCFAFFLFFYSFVGVQMTHSFISMCWKKYWKFHWQNCLVNVFRSNFVYSHEKGFGESSVRRYEKQYFRFHHARKKGFLAEISKLS